MRMTFMAVTLAAILAMPTLALAQVGMENQGDTSGTINNAGNPPGSYTAQGPITYPGAHYTTGQAYAGSGGVPHRRIHHARRTSRHPMTY